jgi:predicted ATPase/class 3 adenylate cyclase
VNDGAAVRDGGATDNGTTPRPRALPTGTVTFLFTDIEGSTRLLQSLGDGYPAVLEEHARRLRSAIRDNDGTEVSTEGDAFFAVFPSPTGAVAAAVAAQRSLVEPIAGAAAPIRVRMGLHTGDGRLGGDNYAGLDVHRAARIAASAHGGQVVLSEATRLLVERALPKGVAIRDLGEHRLKDLDAPERIHQLEIEGLADDFPPLRARRPGNIAPSATSFVGRTDEISAVSDLVEQARVVTLTGPGGTGKTRLALEVARRIGDRFPDGAFFVELDVIREPDLLPSAIARALELGKQDEDVATALKAWLHDRRLLLVLDNFEQIVAAAPIVAALVAAAPDVRILVTSRAPLRIYGEQEYPVPPLRLPDLAHLPSSEQLGQYEAVALFIARARSIRPDFAITDANAPAVAELCARLDGLPLALELAAARVKLLSPDAILRRMSARLDVLSAGSVNLPARQRTLRGAIAWSYDLLDEAARRLLERLAVFAGGSDLDAIERVCQVDTDGGVDLLDGLTVLVDNSLVRQVEIDGEPRFSLLETIREFALEMLRERGEDGAARDRHAAWVVDLCEAAEEGLSFGIETAFRRIETNYANVQAALRWALDADAAAAALRIVAAIWRYWQRAGLVEEGRWWATEALHLSGAADRTPVRVRALAALGSLAYWDGDQAGTRAAYEESLAVAREVGDEPGIARGEFNLAFAETMDGHIERATTLMTDALERFRAIGNRHWVLEGTATLGFLETMTDDFDAAEAHIRETIDLSDPGSVRVVDAWTMLAQLERKRKNWDAARSAISEAFRLLLDSRDRMLSVGLAELRGVIEIDAGNVEPGVLIYAAAEAMRKRTGGGPPPSIMGIGDVVGDARRDLGDEATDRILRRAAAMADDETIAMATDVKAANPQPA